MGDYERTFGAGANIDGIIEGFNRNFLNELQTHGNADLFIPKHFFSFQEASTWAKSNPGSSIRKSPTGIGYIEVRKTISHFDKGSKKNISILLKPGDLEVEETHAAYAAKCEIEKILARPNSSIDNVIEYISSLCSIGGVTSYYSFSSPLPPVAKISKSVIDAGWQLYPISDVICLIDSTGDGMGRIDGALITVLGVTELISGGSLSQKIYNAIIKL